MPRGSGRHGGGRRPRLSVVVPAYNVEAYLSECLRSILSQSFRELEVIVVDDGSTDASAEVAERWAVADRRVRVVRQHNAGLGAARNAGVSHARGDYLTFVDSDDLVAPGGYEAMMRTIERTRSDMVVGTVMQQVGARREVGRLMRENHACRREGVTVGEMPLILADVFAVNKIYRSAFWSEARLRFPEGVRYEDQPTLTQAFLSARQFDVIPETVYLWQKRTGETSITQTRHRLNDLADRMLTKRLSSQAVMSFLPQAKEVWYGKILPVDVWEYCRAAVGAGPEYWAMLREAMTEFWNATTVPFVDTEIPVQQRLMGWLVLHDRRDDLERLLAAMELSEGATRPELCGGDVLYPLAVAVNERHELPPGTYILGRHELAWEARVVHARWEDSTLLLDGFALINNVPTTGRETTVEAHAVGPGETVLPLTLTPRYEPRATRFVARAGQNYDSCGFTICVDLEGLWERSARHGGGESVWRFRLRRCVEMITAGGDVTGFRPSVIDPEWTGVGPSHEARLVDRDGQLALEMRPLRRSHGATPTRPGEASESVIVGLRT